MAAEGVAMSQAMTGDGDYDRHSQGQYRDALTESDLVAAAAGAIAAHAEAGELVMADYGCAQGRVSNALIGVAVRAIRERHPDVPIHVIHNDLLANDWGALFDTLRGDDSYLGTDGGPITPMTSAASFYEPVTPPGLVDLGMSFAAAQWLSAPGPSGTGSALYFDQLQGEARDVMADRAGDDWSRFLRLRADELVPGGRLVVAMMGLSDDGQATGRDAWRLVREIAEQLVAEGALDRARLDAYVLPVYERSVDEVRRPFSDDEVGERLALEQLTLADSAHPALEQYHRDGDAVRFAHDFVGFFRAFSEPSLRAGLGMGDSAVAELYRRLLDRLEAAPDDFDFTVHLLTIRVAST